MVHQGQQGQQCQRGSTVHRLEPKPSESGTTRSSAFSFGHEMKWHGSIGYHCSSWLPPQSWLPLQNFRRRLRRPLQGRRGPMYSSQIHSILFWVTRSFLSGQNSQGVAKRISFAPGQNGGGIGRGNRPPRLRRPTMTSPGSRPFPSDFRPTSEQFWCRHAWPCRWVCVLLLK